MKTTKRKRYAYRSRDEAETAVSKAEHELLAHSIALNCLFNDEFHWTSKLLATNDGYKSEFQMGVARCNGPLGGVLILREQYGEQKPTQRAFWAEEYIRTMQESLDRYSPADPERQAFRACFYAVREIYNKKVKE